MTHHASADVGLARLTVHTPTGPAQWLAPPESLPLDDTPGSPWVLVPPSARAAFDEIVRAGVPLAESHFGAPMVGVKCGCNAAFVVAIRSSDPTLRSSSNGDPPTSQVEEGTVEICAPRIDLADDRAPARRGAIERALLRPLVRGDMLRPWTLAARDAESCSAGGQSGRQTGCREWVIWTHESEESGGGPLPNLPTHAARWLAPWQHRLAARADTKGRSPWWTLFRTEAAACTHPRVVWADVGRSPRAAVLGAGDPTVPLNSCYVVCAPALGDAHALCTLLNSAPVTAWLNALAEPARGGYRRYLGWTVGLLPIPRDWHRACAVLGPIGKAAARGTLPPHSWLTEVVARAYGLDPASLRPLLSWSGP